jgi:hypothetical protein
MVLGHDRILSCALAASVGGLAPSCLEMNRLRGVDFQLRSSTFTKNLYRLWDRIPSMKTPGKEKSGRRAPGKLRAGSLVTVSENKRTTDRSLVQTIWEIVAMNKAHVVLRFHAGNRPIDSESLTQVVPLHEHDFYRADDLAAAFEAPAKQPSATIVRIR